jgi:WD40-like Beta Propeller Repeat.
MRIEYIFLSLLFSTCGISLQAQTLDDAKNRYQEGRYAEALPVFQAEYLNNPGNASLNQWLGVSLYETGRVLEAEKYLAFASQKKITEAYIHLGALYVKMYRFEDAEKEFEKYQRANRRNKEALEKLELEKEYAEKLKRAISRVEDIQIIDSLVLPKSDFLSAYHLSASSGSLMPISDFFNNLPATDKTLYMNERKDKIYYSQGDPATGTGLFTMDKLLDSFGNEKTLSGSINAGGNQAYPFVMSDGLTFYFASTGHQSLGGYDLFVTRYNLASDSYLTPNQLNMPFNSPFNDYMMAVDEEKGVGWFASDRYQPADSVCIYTFIPNPQVTLLESDDEVYLARRAMISSIADTWKEGTDYAGLRAKARQRAVSQQQPEGDFEFVINDRTTYHSLSDFKNSQARSIFSQALGLGEQLRILNKELSEKRDRYASSSSTGETLRASILDLEKQSESLFREIERLRIQARNEEIRTNFN